MTLWPESLRHFSPFTHSPAKGRRPFRLLSSTTPPDDQQVAAKEPDEIESDDLRRVVTRTIQMLRDPAEARKNPLCSPGISTCSWMR